MPFFFKCMCAEARRPFWTHDLSRPDHRWLLHWNRTWEKNTAQLFVPLVVKVSRLQVIIIERRAVRGHVCRFSGHMNGTRSFKMRHQIWQMQLAQVGLSLWKQTWRWCRRTAGNNWSGGRKIENLSWSGEPHHSRSDAVLKSLRQVGTKTTDPWSKRTLWWCLRNYYDVLKIKEMAFYDV